MFRQRLASAPFAVVALVACGMAGPAVLAQDARNRDVAQPFGLGFDNSAAKFATPAAAPAAAPPARPLGVMARNTTAGVEIVSVSPGSVAQSSGLDVGDTIVTVGGYQVGLVGDRLYDLGDEVSRRISPAGQVPMLVHVKRTSELALKPVQFDVATRSVSGVLTAEGNATVPRTSLITVRLLDVTEPQWRDVALTQGQLPVTGGFPVSYRLDPPPLTPQHRYAIDARVEDGGRLLLQTPAPIAIAWPDRDQRIDLVLSSRGVQPTTTTAGLAPAAQIQQWIQQYLGRPARPYETEVWLADLQQGKSLANVQAGILSSSEFFERQRSSRDLYVAEVFRQLYGVPPSPAQLADLQARYDRVQGVRLQFVEQLQQQPR
jgi:uncharacterized lipoprotein YbaY